MEFEFMTADTVLPPCMPLPTAILRLPVSSTAKVMYARLLDATFAASTEDTNGILFVRFPIVELAAALSRSSVTVKRSLKELEDAGLKMVLRLYEDMVAGRISEANFNLMLDKTQKEQAELKERVAQGRKKLADEMRLAMDAKQWVDAIQEYADITELDAATLNRLIKEIVVHEHIDSDKTRHISIEIHFNLKPIPEVEQVKG